MGADLLHGADRPNHAPSLRACSTLHCPRSAPTDMPFPKQREIELPLLAAVDALAGTAKPRDIYPLVAALLPN